MHAPSARGPGGRAKKKGRAEFLAAAARGPAGGRLGGTSTRSEAEILEILDLGGTSTRSEAEILRIP